MPRGAEFTDVEMGQIMALRKEGKGYAYIAQQLGRTKAGIQSFIKRMPSSGVLPLKQKRSGRQKK